MRALGVVLIVACGGCDVLFQLRQVADGDAGTGGDGQGVDATGPLDEDGDGVLDDSDNCPTIENGDQANHLETDVGIPSDEVGDACDPNPTTGGDTLFFTSFATLAGFDHLGAVTLRGDTVTLAAPSGTADLTTSAAIANPERIEVSIQQTDIIAGDQGLFIIAVDASDVVLRVGVDTSCPGSQPCTYLEYAGSSAFDPWAAEIDQVRGISYDTNQVVTITTTGSSHTTSGVGTFPLRTGAIGVEVKNTTGAVHYLLVYGHT